MPKKFFFLIASLILSAMFSMAQVPPEILFSRVTKKEGLASNTVFHSLRDKQGFLWIATQNGLQRYDGNRFVTFRHIPGNAASIAANNVNRLYYDNKGRLWLLFEKTAGLFNTTNFSFKPVKLPAPVNIVKKIMEDAEGRVVLFADSKQFLFDESRQEFNSTYSFPVLPAGFTVGDMAFDTLPGKYWLTGKMGSLLYDPKTKLVTWANQQNGNSQLPDSLALVKNSRYPLIAKDGNYWWASWIPFTAQPPVIYKYDKKSKQVKKFEKIRAYKADSYYEVWGIFQQSNGTIWIYGMGLLAYYKPEEDRFIQINSDPFRQNGIDYDFINNLYEDSEKNVWVSSNKGLYRFNIDAQVFRNIPNKRPADTTVITNAINAILQTQDGNIWVATAGAGVFAYNSQLQPLPNPASEPDPLKLGSNITGMMQRRNAEIWLGLREGEIKIYNPSTGISTFFSPSLFKGDAIQQLLEDKQGNVWIGTNSGMLVKCKDGNWRDSSQSLQTILTDVGDIMKLYEDSSGRLWVCSAITGLYQLNTGNGKTIRHYTEGADKGTGLLNEGATDIVQINDSMFAVASDGLCFLNYKKNTFRYLTPSGDFPSEHITNLIFDKQKRLWVALDGGLYRYNIDKQLHVSYGAEDGLTNDIFQVAGGTLLKDGRIVFGTTKDFIIFDPEKTINRNAAPKVYITGITVGSKYVSVDSIIKLDKLELSHDNTFINIELSTLHFRDQYSVLYMLEGLDKTWKEAANKQVTYQYLPPGSYTLLLKCENGEGSGVPPITKLHIHINPPFWKTWWFLSFLLLLIGGTLFWLDHERSKRKDAILKMRSDIADGLHQEINAALGNITILSEMAKMKAATEPEKSKEFIEQIHNKSQNMTLAMEDMLWSIDPENDSMANFMNRYREYIDSLRSGYGVQIDLLLDKKAENLPLKMKMRNDIFWLFKGGITNVVKTGGTNCRIYITHEKPNLIYTLEFDTTQMDALKLTNLRQRPELTERLEALQANLDFREHRTSAAFILTIPLKQPGV